MLSYFEGGDTLDGSKGKKNKRWTKDEKLRILHRYFNDHIGQTVLAREERISRGMLWRWIQKYRLEGEAGFEYRKKPGNKFSALHRSKSLTLEERQRLIIEKQQIEIERLKKGYIVKGAGADKEYVSLKDANTKS